MSQFLTSCNVVPRKNRLAIVTAWLWPTALLYIGCQGSRPVGAMASPAPAWVICRCIDCAGAHPERWLRPPLAEQDRAIEHWSIRWN